VVSAVCLDHALHLSMDFRRFDPHVAGARTRIRHGIGSWIGRRIRYRDRSIYRGSTRPDEASCPGTARRDPRQDAQEIDRGEKISP